MKLLAPLLLVIMWSGSIHADTIRVATYNVELSRKHPGLLLRDLERGDSDDIAAALTTIVEGNADILALQGIDWDEEQRTLAALSMRLKARGLIYPYRLTAAPNSGIPSGFDLDGDGTNYRGADAFGWGRYRGDGSIAILSKWPLDSDAMRDFTHMLWRDLPDHQMPRHADGAPFPSHDAWEVMRLSYTNHWAVPVQLPNSNPIWLLTYRASPPVFDGAEDLNGRRNADETRLWELLLDGQLGAPLRGHFVIVGDANLDPERGDGRRETIAHLLAHKRVQDALPTDTSGQKHTVVWQRTGPMRVDYVLPSKGLQIEGAGILRNGVTRHGLVWVDISQ